MNIEGEFGNMPLGEMKVSQYSSECCRHFQDNRIFWGVGGGLSVDALMWGVWQWGGGGTRAWWDGGPQYYAIKLLNTRQNKSILRVISGKRGENGLWQTGAFSLHDPTLIPRWSFSFLHDALERYEKTLRFLFNVQIRNLLTECFWT
jgi:hypothetical protein